MTQMFVPKTQHLSWKRMCLPSGDQSGKFASSEAAVSRCWFWPLASITQTAESRPSWFESKAILEPSGDHLGSFATESGLVSTVALPLPSEAITSIEQPVWPQLWKAICLPFGE